MSCALDNKLPAQEIPLSPEIALHKYTTVNIIHGVVEFCSLHVECYDIWETLMLSHEWRLSGKFGINFYLSIQKNYFQNI